MKFNFHDVCTHPCWAANCQQAAEGFVNKTETDIHIGGVANLVRSVFCPFSRGQLKHFSSLKL